MDSARLKDVHAIFFFFFFFFFAAVYKLIIDEMKNILLEWFNILAS